MRTSQQFCAMFSKLVAGLCFVAVSASAAFVEPQQLTNGWSVTGRTAEPRVQFTVALVQQNIDALKGVASEVSDPTNARYTDYLTANEIAVLTAPSADDVAAVTNWLTSNNVK